MAATNPFDFEDEYSDSELPPDDGGRFDDAEEEDDDEDACKVKAVDGKGLGVVALIDLEVQQLLLFFFFFFPSCSCLTDKPFLFCCPFILLRTGG